MTQHEHGREWQLGRAFVGLADTLVDDYDVIDLLDRLVSYSVELLGVEAAGILLADPQRRLRVVASSSEDAESMELLQLQADEGPCVECFRSGLPVSVVDLADTAGRWPVLAAVLTSGGMFRSVHALPLRLRGEAIGAMNLFHHQPGALPEDDLALGQAMADVATIGILQERSIRRGELFKEQMQTALNSRVIIEQAKGVLAEQDGLSMDDAFGQLRSYSRNRNQRLSEVARRVVEGDLDADALATSSTGLTVPPRIKGRGGSA